MEDVAWRDHLGPPQLALQERFERLGRIRSTRRAFFRLRFHLSAQHFDDDAVARQRVLRLAQNFHSRLPLRGRDDLDRGDLAAAPQYDPEFARL